MKSYSIKDKNINIDFLNNWVKDSIDKVNNGYPSQYITVTIEQEICEEYYCNTAKLRVSDHSGKKENNKGQFTLSFITSRCDQGYSLINNEWELEDITSMLTTTSEYVKDIIEWELNNNLELEKY